jgi:hypothetical protein
MWNRSSAFSLETIAIINTATAKAVQDAIHIFESALGDVALTDEQHADAILMLARGVTDGIAKFVETLKK